MITLLEAYVLGIYHNLDLHEKGSCEVDAQGVDGYYFLMYYAI